jgi:hypothetical protein
MNIVLVHGARADGSSWGEVIARDVPEQQNRHCRTTAENWAPAAGGPPLDTSDDVDPVSRLNYVIWRNRWSWPPY